MITTRGTNNKIIIEFKKEDSDELKRFVYSKIEEISSILNLIPKFANSESKAVKEGLDDASHRKSEVKE